MSEKQKRRLKCAQLYGYTKGTEYYLMNRVGFMQPIVFNISSQDGQNFTFMPNETIGGIYDINAFTDNSLLKGITKIMAKFTKLSVDLSLRSLNNSTYNKDKRFIFPFRGKKEVSVYIDYTNNMIFQDNAEDYKEIIKYIFPNYRNYAYSRIDQYMPKDLIKIPFNENLLYLQKGIGRQNDAIDYFKKYISLFGKDETLQKQLKCLKIRQQIDIPTKFVVYGVCNKFGKNNENSGLVGILYIEHKTTLSDYIKFKDECNKMLDNALKPLNMTHQDILDLTYQEASEKYDSYDKIDRLARACGRVKDPRGCSYKIDKYTADKYDYMYWDDSEYSDEFGLYRWEAIKKYYPELYKGLKIILDIYNKFKESFNDKVQKDFDMRIKSFADEYTNKILTHSDDQIFDTDSVIKYINELVSNIQPIKVDDLDDLYATIDVLNQNILDKIGEACQKYYKKILNDYSLEHPRAKKAEIEYRDVFLEQNNNSDVLKYCPFDEKSLPHEIKDILNDEYFKWLQLALYYYAITFKVNPMFYVNGKKLIYDRKNLSGLLVYKIDDIHNALQTLKFQYVNNFVNPEYRPKVTPNIYRTSNEDVFFTQKEVDEVIEALLCSPIKLKLQWVHNDYYNERPKLIEPVNDKDDESDINKNKWRISSQRRLDDILADTKTDISKIRNFINFVIIFEYQNPSLMVEKFKQTTCYKKYLATISETEITK